MAMTATCRIINETGQMVMLTGIDKVNDDATFHVAPPVGTKLENGQSCVVSMGNRSLAPRGVGFKADFVDASFDSGGIYLDDRAVGRHSFKFSGSYQFVEEDIGENEYAIHIRPN